MWLMAPGTRPITENKLRALFVTSEIHPLIKTGGLADVSAALPAALRQVGVDIKVLVPGYRHILAGLHRTRLLARLDAYPGMEEVRLLSARMPDTGVPVIVVDHPPSYDRDGGPYVDAGGHDWPDNGERFGLFSRVAALLGSSGTPLKWRPDILHCNDWQAGLAPAYLHFQPGPRAATIMTVHNLAFQGVFPYAFVSRLGLPPESFHVNGVEYYGQMSFLKAGLYYANHITTVSPTYGMEIQGEPLGFGLQGLLAGRRDHLTGILNGVDAGHWNPETDPYLAKPYGRGRIAGKKANKLALQERFGLQANAEIPLLAMISRITDQKGSDLVLDIAPALIASPAQLFILGTGDVALEQGFTKLARRHPAHVRTVIGFDEGLSHLLEAGADIFLMPSRFEPCGLNQMYSQLYGTPPVVHATGGLADTVVDVTPETIRNGTATGFVAGQLNAATLLETTRRAIDTYHDKRLWRAIQRNGMGQDFSWERSARAYLNLYGSLLTPSA